MSGGVAAPAARIRIKGRKLSVIRFLTLSIAYTTPWIIMLSQLAYYSRIYGPQVLLQLNIAYYLPSIPILLLAGHFEKLLDEQFGTTTSMAIRLTVGLSGCAAIAASYPFIPARLSHLLWVVVALGSISAVAFSTSYQLVAWFRSADTIALGIGCVASGPLALVIQLALQIGTTPKRWQWIGLFETAAGLVVVGLVAAWSLFYQYWGILSGTEPYDDGSLPLLSSDEQEQQEHADMEAGEQALMLSRMLTMQDPFQGFPYTTTPGLAFPYLLPLLRRAASDDLSEYRRQTTRAHTGPALNRHNTFISATPAQHAAAIAANHSLHRHQRTANLGLQQVVVMEQPRGMLPNIPSSSNHTTVVDNADAQYYHSDSGKAVVQPAATFITGQPTAAWWPVAERQSAAIDRIVDSLASGSIHSGSRPASPSPIPSVKLSSYVDELPDFGGHGSGQVFREAPASAPVKHTAYLLGDDEEAELLSRLAAQAAICEQDFLLAGDGYAAESASHSGVASSPAHSQHDTAAAASATLNQQAVEPYLRSEHSLSIWANNAKQYSGSPSGSPAQTPTYHAASLQAQAALNASKQQLQQQYQQQQVAAAKPPMPSGSGQDLQQMLQQPRLKRSGSTGSACSAFSAASAAGGHASVGVAGSGSAAARSTGDVSVDAADSGAGPSSKEQEEQESMGQVYLEVFSYTWMVVLAALISSTLLNCIFPFFTYVESSGMLGEYLPQVLFYTRMLSDIVGRLVPRKKALAITSPVALLSLSGGLLLAAAAFFTYLQVPPRMQHDPYVMVLVLALWLGGGYINTMSYILAPSLVPARSCTKASALMALTYQVAHILGLLIAIALALWLYGDISGGL